MKNAQQLSCQEMKDKKGLIIDLQLEREEPEADIAGSSHQISHETTLA